MTGTVANEWERAESAGHYARDSASGDKRETVELQIYGWDLGGILMYSIKKQEKEASCYKCRSNSRETEKKFYELQKQWGSVLRHKEYN